LPETALVLSGLEGVGKSFLAKIICRLIGDVHSWNTDNAETVFGRFNAPLAGCLFLCLDETGSARHHTYTKKLMSLITKDTVQIEEKFGAITTMNNSCSVMIMENDSWLVQASPESRRWNCLSVSKAQMQNDEYFSELWKELDEDEGWEALMYYFMHEVDLSSFNPRKILVTEELRRHRDNSLKGVNAIWNEILETGELITFTQFGEFYDVPVIRMYELFNRGRSRREAFSDIAIGLALKELIPDLVRYRDSKKGRQYFYRFPSLQICRNNMDKVMGSERDWSECLQDEWIREPFERDIKNPKMNVVYDAEENDRAVRALMKVVDNTKE
jgi:hypothetical protein